MDDLGVADFYKCIAHPLTLAVYRMQQRGMWLDKVFLQEKQDEYRTKVKVHETLIKDIADDQTLNPNSGDHLRKLLYEKLGLKPPRTTKAGKPSVDELSIKRLALKYPNPLFDVVLSHRKYSKLLSTYLTTLYTHPDGRVRTRFLVHGTATGRLSSRSPNFQNIPYELRRLFAAPPGRVLVSADASQLELRLIAYASNCEKLIKAFQDGDDVHRLNAVVITGKPDDYITTYDRNFAKRFIYCQNYGGGAKRISELLFQDAGIVRSVQECERDLAALRRAYPEVYDWRERVLRDTKKSGVITNEFGRKRVVFARGEEVAGIAFNTPIQSTAADYINSAFIRLDGRGLFLTNQVHDEILAECDEEKVDETAQALKEELEHPVTLWGREVVLPADINCGIQWGGLAPWRP
jgi:DNA polymerase-1